jgi:hypothetical protein
MAKARQLSEGVAAQFHGPDEPIAWQRQRKIYDSLSIANRSRPLSFLWATALVWFGLGILAHYAPLAVYLAMGGVLSAGFVWFTYRAKHYMRIAQELTQDGERGFRVLAEDEIEEGHPLVFTDVEGQEKQA